MLNTMSKIRGQVKSPGYPQAEGLLGECMAKFGRELGEETNFGGFTKGVQLLKSSQLSFAVLQLTKCTKQPYLCL